MKKTKFTEEQIAFILKQADTGTSIDEICCKTGICQATYYQWRKKYGNLGVAELRRLRQLEEENKKLKQLVADLSLDKAMLQDVLKKSSETCAKKGSCILFAAGMGYPNFSSVPLGSIKPFSLLL